MKIFVGYSLTRYRLQDPTTKRIIISRNIKFNKLKKNTSNILNMFSRISDEIEFGAKNAFEESVNDSSVPTSENATNTTEDSVSKPSREKKIFY